MDSTNRAEDARDLSEHRLREFAKQYTAAWCSQDPASVAAFFSPAGSLKVNDGAPAVGSGDLLLVVVGWRAEENCFPDGCEDRCVVLGLAILAAEHWTGLSTSKRARRSSRLPRRLRPRRFCRSSGEASSPRWGRSWPFRA